MSFTQISVMIVTLDRYVSNLPLYTRVYQMLHVLNRGSMDIRQQVIPNTGRCHQKMLIESFDLSSFKLIGTRPRLPEIREFWSSSLNGHIRDAGTRRIFDKIWRSLHALN